MNIRPVFVLPFLATVFAFTPAASAQEIGIQYKKKNVSIGISLGNYGAPIRYAPRPVEYAQREWIPSHYETISEQVWCNGREERVFVPAVYHWRTDACGRPHQVITCPAHYETRCSPGHFETVTRQVWVEGGWRVRHCR